MTSTEFAAYVRQKTKTNSTTFTDAEILALTVPAQDDIAKEVIKANEDFFGLEVIRNITVSQRNYAFASELIQIKILQAKLNGTDWEVLDEYDNNTLRINTDNTSIKKFFSDYGNVYNPGYFLFGSEIIILNDSDISAVTDGLKMWAIFWPTKLTSLSGSDDMSVRPSATGVGFPRQFHEILARRVIIEWKESQDPPVKLTARELKYDNDLQEALDSIKGLNLDRSVEATTPYDDGQDY